jgi:hypothetical protein
LDLSLLLRYFVDPTSAFGILIVVEEILFESSGDEDEAGGVVPQPKLNPKWIPLSFAIL